ncbi:hypothetical protein THAOC_26709, partial [Thalassiosira oceanica]
MFERIECVNVDATGRPRMDWVCSRGFTLEGTHSMLLDPQRELPTRPNWGSRKAATEVGIVNLTHLAKDGSNPAHRKEDQADDPHPELVAEKKNLPAGINSSSFAPAPPDHQKIPYRTSPLLVSRVLTLSRVVPCLHVDVMAGPYKRRAK